MITRVEYDDRVEYINEKGNLHREDDLPAIEYFNGDKLWYIDGVQHRENGPAVVFPIIKLWYLNGKLMGEKGHEKELIKIKLERLIKNYKD